MMPTAVYAGSFDPLTFGHLDLICRGAQNFNLIVAVGVNSRKTPLFTVEERISLIKEAIESRMGISVMPWGTPLSFINPDKVRVETMGESLLVDYCHKIQASVIVRGLRAVSDFEAEMAIADANHEMARDIETVFYPTRKEYTFISSSTVKEIARHPSATGWLSLEKYVPPNVLKALKAKLKA